MAGESIMATVIEQRTENSNPHNRTLLVRDLCGKKIRLTYYRRDISFANTFGLKPGEKGPGDTNLIIEGQLVPVLCILPKRNHLWGIETVAGEIQFPMFSPTDPSEMDYNLSAVSQFDGKRNGTYKLEVIE